MHSTLGDIAARPILVPQVVENSYRDFHAKGVDYLCLSRSPERTIKLYFFDGAAPEAPEVVCPHTHRYGFHTRVLCGRVANTLYRETSGAGEAFNLFAYQTPLNGGALMTAFTPIGRAALDVVRTTSYGAVDQQCDYTIQHAEEIHTIRIQSSDAVLLLTQSRDQYPVGRPTLTFCRTTKPPELKDLYRRFTADQVVDKLHRLEARTGLRLDIR